jgi:hypothetical protein
MSFDLLDSRGVYLVGQNGAPAPLTAMGRLGKLLQVGMSRLSELVINVKGPPFNAKGDGVSDDTAALNAALAAASAGGGGTVYLPAATYRIDGQITIPYTLDNTHSPKGWQSPIRITGAGKAAQGDTVPSTGTILDMRYASTGHKLRTFCMGTLEIDHLSICDNGTANATKFIFVASTLVHIHDVAFYGNLTKYGYGRGGGILDCDQDVISFGSTAAVTDPHAAGINDITTPAETDAFQGYGSRVYHCEFYRIRKAAIFGQWANHIWFTDNVIWANCGGECALELVNGCTNAIHPIMGNVIRGNLIECPYYHYAIKCTGRVYNNGFTDNSYWDANLDTFAACIYFGTLAQYNFVADNHHTGDLVEDVSGTNSYLDYLYNQSSRLYQIVNVKQLVSDNGDGDGVVAKGTLAKIVNQDAAGSQWRIYGDWNSGTHIGGWYLEHVEYGGGTGRPVEIYYAADVTYFRLTQAGQYGAIIVNGSGLIGLASTTGVVLDGPIRSSQTAAATTLGSVAAKLPVYNAAGALVGYVPLYDSIS